MKFLKFFKFLLKPSSKSTAKQASSMIKKILTQQKENPYYKEAHADQVIELWQDVKDQHYYSVTFTYTQSYKKIKILNPLARKEFFLFVIHCVVMPLRKTIIKESKKNKNYYNNSSIYGFSYIANTLLTSLARLKLQFTEQELIELFEFFKSCDEEQEYFLSFSEWPIGQSIVHLEKHLKQHGASETLASFVTEMPNWTAFSKKRNYYGSDIQNAKLKLQKIIREYKLNGKTENSISFEFNPEDVIGAYFNKKIKEADPTLQKTLCNLFHHCTNAKAGKPSKKWLTEAKKILAESDSKKIKTLILDVFNTLIQSKEKEIQSTHNYGNGETYTYSHYTFLHESNNTVIKGIVWAFSHFHDQASMETLARLAERSFQKIPGIGPACAAIGNACIYTLSNSKGKLGLSHLSRLKLRIKQNSTQKLIQKYLDEAAAALGITSGALEEMAVPNFALENGTRTVEFDDYKAKLTISGVGKTSLLWYKPDGTAQKTVPAFIKKSSKLTEKLKKLRADAKQIQQYTSAQRDRIDRIYKEDRAWNWQDFSDFYHNHGLVNCIANKLIWLFEIKGKNISALYHKNEWLNAAGKPVKVEKAETIRLWHPLSEDEKSVLAWRNFLDEKQLVQPLKQAYREVYILTDAEVNTRIYSNRMAAHLLKQHQFNALTSLRGWKYSLLGAYDDGRDGEVASIPLPAYNLTAEYWINIVHDDEAFNDAGIYDYVATDQLRFLNANQQAVELVDVPALALSEIMRDADLFVGVCSVGNDPAWQDSGGIDRFRDYWTSYSFGNLTEVAKTRKTVLERLLPRLKIKNVAKIDGKFLRVQGTVREYKIHIGSSNILMEPNDQYLCIVPDRNANKKTENIFLPFEGDRGLSLILSKAFLLAADDKITDSTILSQIKH